MHVAKSADHIKSSPKEEILVETHAYLVKRIAYQLLARLPGSVLIEDLVQAGMEGLLDAGRLYNVNKGASFETYASIRIRGSMLDEVRRYDWVPRSVHRYARMISDTARRIGHECGRDAKNREVADALHLKMQDYHTLARDISEGQVFGFEDLNGAESLICPQEKEQMNPEEKVIQEDRASQLKQLIKALPARESMVLILYYQRDLSLKEIGDIFDIGESRVSQILTQALNRLKVRFKD